MATSRPDPSSPDAPRAPRSAVPASNRHRGSRPWADVAVPVLLVVLLGGLGMVLYTGRSRGGFSRVPTRAEARCALCRSNLEALAAVWRVRREFPPDLRHERYGGMDGLVCANDDGVAYALRDTARFPVDASRAADEPLAACVGRITTTERWRAPHGETVLVAFADGTVREMDWTEVGLAAGPAEASPPAVGPESASPVLRVMRLAR